jgi:hypothetical protein
LANTNDKTAAEIKGILNFITFLLITVRDYAISTSLGCSTLTILVDFELFHSLGIEKLIILILN